MTEEEFTRCLNVDLFAAYWVNDSLRSKSWLMAQRRCFDLCFSWFVRFFRRWSNEITDISSQCSVQRPSSVWETSRTFVRRNSVWSVSWRVSITNSPWVRSIDRVVSDETSNRLGFSEGHDGIYTTAAVSHYLPTHLFQLAKTHFSPIVPPLTIDYAAKKIMHAILVSSSPSRLRESNPFV